VKRMWQQWGQRGKWANDRFYGSLVVQLPSPGIVQFTDLDERESILVRATSLFDVTMTVMPGSDARPERERLTPEKLTPIAQEDATHHVRGKGIATRDVWHYVTREHCKRLRAGLTVHRSAFSSTPHGFELSPEPGFEEVFYFLVVGDGKALLEGEGLWPDGRAVDAAWPVRNRTLAQVPMGWHRVAALAGADGGVPLVGYVWCYLALPGRGWEKD
jgi:5-deoxy-D-glucuronate isomerase